MTASGTELTADCTRPLDRWERPTFWLVLTTLAIAVILYAWVTVQMTLAEVGQPTDHTVYEAIEQDASLSPGLPLSHGTASSW